MEDYDLIETPDGGRVKVPKKDLVSTEEKGDDLIESLRKEALTLNPRHGDKLYPLEVLGVYKRVHNNSFRSWLELGNPETFIDDRIKEYIRQVDKNRFSNRLERELIQNQITKELFLLRLNYAYLMQEGTDEINIHRGRVGSLLFSDGEYKGPLGSAFDIEDEQLDELAEKFYKDKSNLEKKATGTKQSIREKIINRLTQMGYMINYDFDEVYYELNKRNSVVLEEGLIARIAYLVFITEEEQATPKIDNRMTKICKHCRTQFMGNSEDRFCSQLCERMFEKLGGV